MNDVVLLQNGTPLIHGKVLGTQEPVNNLSSSVICSSLDYGYDRGLWPASVTNDFVNILIGLVQVFNHNVLSNYDGITFADNY